MEVYFDSKKSKYYTNVSILRGLLYYSEFGNFGTNINNKNINVDNQITDYDNVVIPAVTDGTWISCVEAMGKWYEANIHTYQSQYPPGKGSGSRKMYMCELINGKVADDCSGYVSACLQYFGTFSKGYVTNSTGFTQDAKIAEILKTGGFIKLPYSWETVQPYDIISYCGHVEILGKKGDYPKSWGWGSVHDNNFRGNGRPPMPAGTGKKPKGSTYKTIWRYQG